MFVVLGFLSVLVKAQELPLLKVSDNQKYIVTQNNKPFFWLGGTAWELIHRLNKDEIDLYLTDRAKKGFTVIQTVVLAELDGLNTPNAYGEKPLINNDPTRFNKKYFELVDYVVNRAEGLGLYTALLPTWGDKFNKGWGVGPVVFNPDNAEIYGEMIARRYLSHNNIIWILGGDRVPANAEQADIIRAMAKGIRKIDTIHLITYHPSGGKNATDFFNGDWLDLDMFQSGHSRLSKEYNYVLKSRKKVPLRPVINGEARYENIPDRFWEKEKHGWLDAADARESAYWSIISGAAGYTYGSNDIWQMYDWTRTPGINARTDWEVSLNLPGSAQMGYMKKLFESFSWQSMTYDPSLIQENNPEDTSYIVAALGNNKKFILAYSPVGKPIEIDASGLKTDTIQSYWFNPRSGTIKYIGEFSKRTNMKFKPWADGWGSDFLLIICDQKLDEVAFNNNHDFIKDLVHK